MAAVITGWVVAALGAVLLAGGGWLAALGGSWFYLVHGLGLLATGLLLIRRRRLALWLYAALLALTLAWALWEVGLNWWALTPRGVVPTLIGAWLLLPWIGRALGPRAPAASFWRSPSAALAGGIVLVAAAAVAAVSNDPYDVAGRTPGASMAEPQMVPAGDWPSYGGDAGGRRYSSLDAITPETVSRLKVAWTFHTGDMRGPDDPIETTFEVTPLKIGDTLYLCTPHNHVVALDAATGRQRWRFDPEVAASQANEHLTCRGIAYHADASAPAPEAACAKRILLPTIDARLFALDAATGRRCPGFGEDGVVDLTANMPNLKQGFYMVTSPPVVARDLAIVGGAINDNVSVANPSGVIRAYDARTGRLVWNWDAGNPDETAPLPPGETYTAGAPNSWSIASADEPLGMVYLPMGNKSPDQWGGERSPEVERFSSSIVALDLADGRLRWVFQTVHHDIWDRDVPSQPSLTDLTVDGAVVPALVAPTKQGDVYVLDRRSGRPILPVRETPVAGGTVEGDWAAPTQPVSALSLMPPPLRESDMWGATLFDQLACRIQFRRLRYEGPYTPPSTRGTLVYPGNTGVLNWGGVAVDPTRQVMVGAAVRLAFFHRLIPRENATANYTAKPFGENHGAPFAVQMGPFLSILGLPCQAPPWGGLAAADLRTGELIWRHRNGTVRDQTPVVPIPFKMGTPSLGGPLVTAGGVFFYSGTLDNYLRAYDVTTGEQLWQARLPAGGQATPMTYVTPDGKQMVVVAAGGHGSFGTTLGDAVVAFALDGDGQGN